MNSKGFTLVELIAVVAILGLLAIITTPAYETISNNIKRRNYESKKSVIKKETINYVEKYMKNETYDPEREDNKSQTICFTVKYLIQNGIISSDDENDEYIKNDVTGEVYKDNKVFIEVSYNLNNLRLEAKTDDESNMNCSETKG